MIWPRIRPCSGRLPARSAPDSPDRHPGLAGACIAVSVVKLIFWVRLAFPLFFEKTPRIPKKDLESVRGWAAMLPVPVGLLAGGYLLGKGSPCGLLVARIFAWSLAGLRAVDLALFAGRRGLQTPVGIGAFVGTLVVLGLALALRLERGSNRRE